METLPGILLHLLHTKGHTAVLLVYLQNHCFHDIVDAHHLARVLDPLEPRHLRNVHKTLHTLFQLHKCTILHKTHNTACDLLGAHVLVRHLEPRVLGYLLEPQRYPLVLRIELEHLDLDLVSHLEQFGGMVHPAPGHVSNVQKTVYPAQVHKTTIVGDILDDPVHNRALLDTLESLFLEFLAFFFQERAAGKHDVTALLVELDDLEAVALADELLEVAHRAQIHLRTRQEGLHTDIHGETALDPARDDPFHQLAPLAG